MMQMMAYFYIYSMVGWTLEVMYNALAHGAAVNPGMLNGPLCLIYGLGMLGIIRYIKPKEMSVRKLFLSGFFIASLLELGIGILIENIFHSTWWDYSHRLFNLGGYICLTSSIAWGLAAIFMVKLVHPFIHRLVKNTPQFVIYSFLTVMSLLLAIDTTVSATILLRTDHKLGSMEAVALKVHEATDDMGNALASGLFMLVQVKEDVEYQMSVAEEEIWQHVTKIGPPDEEQDDLNVGKNQFNAKADPGIFRNFPGIRLEAADPSKLRPPVNKPRKVVRHDHRRKGIIRQIRC